MYEYFLGLKPQAVRLRRFAAEMTICHSSLNTIGYRSPWRNDLEVNRVRGICGTRVALPLSVGAQDRISDSEIDRANEILVATMLIEAIEAERRNRLDDAIGAINLCYEQATEPLPRCLPCDRCTGYSFDCASVGLSVAKRRRHAAWGFNPRDLDVKEFKALIRAQDSSNYSNQKPGCGSEYPASVLSDGG